jgi:Transglycosylase SLT domain
MSSLASPSNLPAYDASRSARGIDPGIVGAIARASQAAHVDFGYMMAQAKQESDFQPNARASTSSASGLFQFIESTWLSAVKQFGAKYGLGQYADQITTGSSGSPHVSSPALRQQILNLRNDPTISADLAAEMAHANTQTLAQNLGHAPSTTALYLAHFLGANGASELVKTAETAGSTKAADLLPQAAAANRSVFYDKVTGAAKTVAQIYSNFAEKLDTQIANFGGSVGETDPLALAAASQSAPTTQVAAVGLSDLPDRVSQPMMTMMNTIALTALKLVGDHQDTDQTTATDRNHKKTEPDPVAA